MTFAVGGWPVEASEKQDLHAVPAKGIEVSFDLLMIEPQLNV